MISAPSLAVQGESINALQAAHDNLAKELLRLTVLLATHEPHTGDYAELLGRAKSVAEILQNLKR